MLCRKYKQMSDAVQPVLIGADTRSWHKFLLSSVLTGGNVPIEGAFFSRICTGRRNVRSGNRDSDKCNQLRRDEV